jgi:histidinol-phosphate/aromatic aminotransferase/cobyric acid decarboxylase-like protein
MSPVAPGAPELAVWSYGPDFRGDDGNGQLNLAWTLDEREWLDLDLPALLERELGAEAADHLPWVDRYMVQDPYGDECLGPAARAFFGLRESDCALIAAAGVGSLLHALTALARPNGAAVVGDVYPDFPHWLSAASVPCRGTAGLDEAAECDASLILIDRPSWSGHEPGLPEIRTLCRAAAPGGGWLLVDESNANYAPPDYSAAILIPECPNLLVLRGLSKAYWLGGLRLGFCLVSRSAEADIRRWVAPMSVSSLSLRLAQTLLTLGDRAPPLRARIAEARRETLAALAAAGFPPPSPGSPLLPGLLWMERGEAIQEALLRRGIRTKMQPFWSAQKGGVRHGCRMSLPLRGDRAAAFRRHLSLPPDDGSGLYG